MKWYINSCDGRYNSFDVHFTSECDNKCKHCIDRRTPGKGIKKPDAHAIAKTIIENAEGRDDVMFLGGEPCLYLKELCDCIRMIKQETTLKCYVTTSVPRTCCIQYPKFLELLEIADGVNFSVQHYREEVADRVRCTRSTFDRQEFYAHLPHKEKVRININLVKPYLCERDEVLACLKPYDDLGYRYIKLAELQYAGDAYASFEQIMGIKMKSPYAHGCQQDIDMSQYIPGFQARVQLKRSCFCCEKTLKAGFWDGVKVIGKTLCPPKGGHYSVIYEDGSIYNGWI